MYWNLEQSFMISNLGVEFTVRFGDSTHIQQKFVYQMSEFKTIAKTDSVAEGTGAAFPLDGRMIAIFNEQGNYHAIDDFCPHMGASLAAGHVEDGIVICPWHAWRFKICDGTWCDNPKLGVTAYEVRVVDDEIQVKIEETESEPDDSSK